MATKTKLVNGATVTTHYPTTDPEKDGDYYDIEVTVRLDGKVYLAAYGDAYHDRGYEKTEGFLDAIKMLYGPKFPVLQLSVADRDE